MFDKVVWLFKTAPSRRVFAFFINLYIRGTFFKLVAVAIITKHQCWHSKEDLYCCELRVNQACSKLI